MQEVIPEICEEVKRFKGWKIMSEDNSDRGFLRDSFCKRNVWASNYHETQNKKIKILTYLRAYWCNIVFLQGTDPEYIRQIVEYTETAEHDDAPDSAATMCRFFDTFEWEGRYT